MCGIIGYVGPRNAARIVLEGLRCLEYRGYDSAGLAITTANNGLTIRRSVGKLENLERSWNENPLMGNAAVGHTRWATHGSPTEENAHPHGDCSGKTVVIHNGIVENFLSLREELIAEGHAFRSETDTEVIPHLIEKYIAEGASLEEATRQSVCRLKGAHGIVVMSALEPGRLIAVRVGNAGGITVGIGQGEMFVASDMPALVSHTKNVVFLEDREMVVVTQDEWQCSKIGGGFLSKAVTVVQTDAVSIAKGDYSHFMEKEIFEQARAITDTIRGRVDFHKGDVLLNDLPVTVEQARSLQRVVITACGTALHAGIVGKYLIEKLARIPVDVDYGSEFRYRDPSLDEKTLIITVSQSGETADTLAAIEEARSKGCTTIGIINAVGSQASRVCDGVIHMQAGPEIGVASTKAYTTSLVDLYLLGLFLGKARGAIDSETMRSLVADLARLPDLVGRVLETGTDYRRIASRFLKHPSCLYLGRGINYPTALEGALKLKEISYIHAEGYPAGEMKHGPIALIEPGMPVVVIALKDDVYEKMFSNLEQVKARGGTVVAVASEGDTKIADKADEVVYIPWASALLNPVAAVIPLQLLAYHAAVLRGADVDQPRNLAKSVTVE
jgi:glucosamine--fructose-6-phosphate aminotransferase (isomerizing)